MVTLTTHQLQFNFPHLKRVGKQHDVNSNRSPETVIKLLSNTPQRQEHCIHIYTFAIWVCGGWWRSRSGGASILYIVVGACFAFIFAFVFVSLFLFLFSFICLCHYLEFHFIFKLCFAQQHRKEVGQSITLWNCLQPVLSLSCHSNLKCFPFWCFNDVVLFSQLFFIRKYFTTFVCGCVGLFVCLCTFSQ